MKLVTYSLGTQRRIGFLDRARVCDLFDAADDLGLDVPDARDLRELASVAHLPALRAVGEAATRADVREAPWAHQFEAVTLHAPFRPRQNVIIAGGNTAGSGAELAGPLRYHTKAPSAVHDPGRPLSWPRNVTCQVQAEPDVAVVVGARTSYSPAWEALDNVFGYAVAINVSGDDLKRKHGQWDKAVSLDTFFPWGPVLATSDEVDVEQLTCRLWLNDRVALTGCAGDGQVSIPDILAEISHGMRLLPGDIVLPALAEGVGHRQQPERWLQDGDVIRAAVEGIGEIENGVETYRA